MGQKGHIMVQKGLKVHKKRQKIEFLDLKRRFFSLAELGGNPLTENQCEKKKVFFLSGKGGYPAPPLNGRIPLKRKWKVPLSICKRMERGLTQHMRRRPSTRQSTNTGQSIMHRRSFTHVANTHKINIFFDWLNSFGKKVFDCALHLSLLINSINANWPLRRYYRRRQHTRLG